MAIHGKVVIIDYFRFMQISVIILNYKVRFFLEQCLFSVQKALESIEAEIIVVDNASEDGSAEMVATLFPQVKWIQNEQNVGFPKGNNIGVAEAKGRYICILNPDTVVAEDTFVKILKTDFWKHNSGILGCKLIDGKGNFLPESKRGVPTPRVALTKIFGLYKLFPKSKWCNGYYAMHLDQNQSGQVDILVGAFMVMERSLYLDLGGFDENCFMYSDDIDLSYLALKAGKQNYYFSETTIIHYKGESTVRDQKYVKRFQEAMQFFYQKHFGGSFMFTVLMKVGALSYALFKKRQQQNTSIKVESSVLFSKLKGVPIDIKVDVVYENMEHFSPNPNVLTEVIFDTRDFGFKEIISFMEMHKSNNLIFKNYIWNSNFLIGSNHANEMGEVINLTKNV